MLTFYFYLAIGLVIWFILNEFFRSRCKSIKDLDGNIPYLIFLTLFGAIYIDSMFHKYSDIQGRIYAVLGLLAFIGIMEITGIGRKLGYALARDWFLGGFKFKFGERVSFTRDGKTIIGEIVSVKEPKNSFGIKKDDGEIVICHKDETEFLRHLENN